MDIFNRRLSVDIFFFEIKRSRQMIFAPIQISSISKHVFVPCVINDPRSPGAPKEAINPCSEWIHRLLDSLMRSCLKHEMTKCL